MTTSSAETKTSLSSSGEKSQFIRVVEIWRPDPGKGGLYLSDGAYGGLDEFQEASAETVFAYGSGLPGLAWQARHPKILTAFENSVFARTEIAHAAGLTSAVAIPIFAGEYLQAVILFLCGNSLDSESATGAIEVWCEDVELGCLKLSEGYYGDLARFETLSRSIQFQKGVGLPGEVFSKEEPKLIPDITVDSSAFLRAKYAKEAGISAGVGIPFFGEGEKNAVLTFLSSQATPIARRFEVWKPADSEEILEFTGGIAGGETISEPAGMESVIAKGAHTIGAAWQFGLPLIATGEKADGHESLLVIPVIHEGKLNSILACYN